MLSLRKPSNKYRDAGLLLLRLGIGLMFMYHGYPKVIGGEAAWVKAGGAMQYVGITFMPVLWGFLIAFFEFAGGFLLAVGYMFRPACILLACTMAVTAAMKFATGAGLAGASQALELGIVVVSLMLIGTGKYSFAKG